MSELLLLLLSLPLRPPPVSDPDSLVADDGFLRPWPGGLLGLFGFFFWPPLLEFWLEVLDVAGFFSSFGWEEGCCTATGSVISFVMCYFFSILFCGLTNVFLSVFEF